MKWLVMLVLVLACVAMATSLPFKISSKENLVQVAKSLGATKFVQYLKEANLTKNFTGKENHTLFVPLNAAFENLPKNISGNITALQTLLLSHAIDGYKLKKDFKNKTRIQTMYTGRKLNVTVIYNKTTDQRYKFMNGVNITLFNQRSSNGVVHLVGRLLFPFNATYPNHTHSNHTHKNHSHDLVEVAKSIGATTFVHLLKLANLTSNFTQMKNVTLFVPSNDAFKNLTHFKKIKNNIHALRNLLLYHTVQGMYNKTLLNHTQRLRTLRNGSYVWVTRVYNGAHRAHSVVNGANITRYDVNASNGIIHVVDAVFINGSANVTSKPKVTEKEPNPVTSESGLPSRKRNPIFDSAYLNYTHSGNSSHGGNHTHDKNCTFWKNCTHGNHSHWNNCTSGRNCSHGGNHTEGMTVENFLVQSYGKFSHLINYMMQSGVWSEIQESAVTLIAPNNAAFQRNNGKYMQVLDSNPTLLEDVMKAHIIPGIHPPASLHHHDHLTSLQGTNVRVTMEGGKVSRFNNANVLEVHPLTNGVIYVVDHVFHLQANPVGRAAFSQ